MTLTALPAADALAQLDLFSAVIDARSEDEWALDHLPGAQNWPSLNNAQRIEVGTLYANVSAFEAQKRGAALVAANIAAHINQYVMELPRSWQPLIYCWRGGKRSGSLALVLSQIGFKVTTIEGGYKAFRAAMLLDLPAMAQRLQYRVICGTTGSGKTRLLQALAAAGAQVLDLEALANHRSSVLGLIPGQAQPSQKRFDTLVWDALRQFDPQRVVFIESESKKVGNLAVPDSLIVAMRASPCLRLELPDTERVQLLMQDYDFFVRDPALFCEKLDALVALRGQAVVDRWKSQVATGDIPTVVRELLVLHYDPGYQASIERNFSQYANAKSIAATAQDAQSMAALALKVKQQEDPAPKARARS
jgi:tRNA 2-selenouridine synthase